MPIECREYGETGSRVAVLHGGPGASGYMAGLARDMARSFQVLEPLQRPSGAEKLTVALHVEDLHEVLKQRCPGERVSLVGHSWGAMLALAYAAKCPDGISLIALIGCGTFDKEARARMKITIEERLGGKVDERMAQLEREIPDRDKRLAAMGALIESVDSWDLLPLDCQAASCDARANEETWSDMMRLQAAHVYPQAFSTITCPVAMFHGKYDPHPGKMIRDSLKPYIPQLEYIEWERCGHYPWRESAAREEFLATLKTRLAACSG